MQVLISNCHGMAALCGNMPLDLVTFRHARYSDGTIRAHFTAQEALRNIDAILFYMSRESIDSRLTRLEDELATVRADLAGTQKDLIVNKGQTADIQQQLKRYEEIFILGQIAYFVDTLAAKRVYGDEYVDPLSVRSSPRISLSNNTATSRLSYLRGDTIGISTS